MSNSSLVNYTKISPNKTVPRTHSIDTITIHCMAGNLSIETCGNVFTPTSAQASSNYGVGSDGRIGMYVEEKDRSWCSSNGANDHRAITIEVANDGGADTGWHVSEKAMASLIKLVADICKRNGIKKLVWSTDWNKRVNHLDGCNMTVHRDFSNKSCPGDYLYGKHEYIASEVNKLLGAKTTDVKPTKEEKPKSESAKTTFIKGVQSSLGAKVDGIAGPETLGKTITLSRSCNSRHKVVKVLQTYISTLGYNCGSIDGIYGSQTASAVAKYQKDHGCVADGIITAKNLTWKKLLGL